jgi:hypothetical protein
MLAVLVGRLGARYLHSSRSPALHLAIVLPLLAAILFAPDTAGWNPFADKCSRLYLGAYLTTDLRSWTPEALPPLRILLAVLAVATIPVVAWMAPGGGADRKVAGVRLVTLIAAVVFAAAFAWAPLRHSRHRTPIDVLAGQAAPAAREGSPIVSVLPRPIFPKRPPFLFADLEPVVYYLKSVSRDLREDRFSSVPDLLRADPPPIVLARAEDWDRHAAGAGPPRGYRVLRAGEYAMLVPEPRRTPSK